MAILIKKGNGERLVPEEKMAEFLELGYSVIDSSGKVLINPKPTTIADYKSLVKKLEYEKAALQADYEALKQECEKLYASNTPDSSDKLPVRQATNPESDVEAPQNVKKASKTASRK